ncbi:hypothetical protein BKA63DRAFT_159790 [Paraphoma chrysanthemicola]|nr:hypothetical protein BKA63DRAFT_159790 [Paraphoma chrysanthemicola]
MPPLVLSLFVAVVPDQCTYSLECKPCNVVQVGVSTYPELLSRLRTSHRLGFSIRGAVEQSRTFMSRCSNTIINETRRNSSYWLRQHSFVAAEFTHCTRNIVFKQCTTSCHQCLSRLSQG